MGSGRLEDESASSLCRRLAAESRTGCLLLLPASGDEAQAVRIYLREGRLHTARAGAGGGRLGDRLVGGGHLTADQLDDALALRAAEGPEVRLGQVLVREGLVDREVLHAVLQEQVLDAISVPLGWAEGTWRFVDGEQVLEENPLGMGVHDALMEGARRLGELEVIQRHMGSMDTVVDFPSGGDTTRLALRPDEWAMLTRIDGRATVADIAEASGYTQLEAARIIYGLLSAGVVRKVEDLSAPPPPVEPLPTRDPAAAAGPQGPGVSLRRAGPSDPLAELEALGDRRAGPPAGPACTPAWPAASPSADPAAPSWSQPPPATPTPASQPGPPQPGPPQRRGLFRRRPRDGG